MVIYLYDGSFEGLLTSIYEAYYRREEPEEIHSLASVYTASLFASSVTIETDPEKAEKVVQSIQNKISSQAFRHSAYAFLSEAKGAELFIYQYLRLGWKVGPDVDRYLVDPVWTIHQLSGKVAKERHRMLGLLRFRLLRDDIYYGPMETDHNILGLLAPHFTRRLADQNWIIHDKKRSMAALYNQKEWILTDLNREQVISLAPEEKEYQALWKDYFNNVTITERKNLKQQRSYMPFRYWSYLIEK
ncbi:TIGR03915 family putative DNA repair protein [Heliorestis convoluta]|uniref:DNA metabolism protein n=1 Tax=Heliorestis convoluta TaxID=356322 RepID=A0A5Q2N1Y6_9FIRM|nr:TIGR03915 family putative DNA repair protein [Heliorestis convoluta]QGG49394.1 DNA metabolism protein [Heliorestis convoluta]